MNLPSGNPHNELEHLAREFASRHQKIPPTPRDTLAVLRQAAEAQMESTDTAWTHGWRRGLIALATCVLILGIIWPLYRKPEASETASTGQPADLALDLAEWDMEFEAIYSELSESMESIASEDPIL